MNLSYYFSRSLKVLREHGFRTLFFAALWRMLGKDYEFLSFVFRKGRYFFRWSAIGFSMITDIHNYTMRPDFPQRLDALLSGMDEESKRTVKKFMKRIALLRENNVVHESEIFDSDDIAAQSESIRFMSKNGVFHPTGYYVFDLPEISWKIDTWAVIDCGACDGAESVMFAKLLPKAKVYSFEPNSSNFEKLSRTIENSGFQDRIIAVKRGLSNVSGTARFYGDSGGEVSAIALGTNPTAVEEIEITTLDEFVKTNAIPKVSLIKWDIEGMEIESILGAEGVIRKNKPVLVVSIYHNGKQFFETKSLLEGWGLGYRFKIVASEPESAWTGFVLLAY